MGFVVPKRLMWGSLMANFGAISRWSIRRKLLTTIIPLMILVLTAMGYAFKWVSDRYLGALDMACLDNSRLQVAAGHNIFDILLLIFMCAVAFTAITVYLTSRIITQPMLDLAAVVRAMPEVGECKSINLPDRDKETTILKNSINHLMETVLRQREELNLKDAHFQNQPLPQALDPGKKLSSTLENESIEGVIGASPAMHEPPGIALEAVKGLNERQRIGIAYLHEHGTLSRSQYQTIVGQNVPPRTAQYDLRDLVEQGLLQVKGKGPATRYILPRSQGSRK